MAETKVSTSSSNRKANRLIHEHSPYLLQHAYNPVDWYPWGEEAFKLARESNRPIFLSVGYSTCHWCHVMEKESFESDKIAELLNQHFVPIKVDREERPDVDRVYMSFVTAISGGGGWPMSVFLTPELTPFFGGTYFPPNDKYGRPGFTTLLMRLHKSWSDPSKREEVKQQGSYVIEQLKENIASRSGGQSDPDTLIADVDKYIKTTYLSLYNEFDDKLGGFGGAPKFPRPVVFNFLFTAHRHYQNLGPKDNDKQFKQLSESSEHMANFTLEKMALGGIYDHLGGGFHRYSVDEFWHIPHFEKMLYDQGQLLTAYSVGYQLSTSEKQKAIFRRVVAETVEYLTRDMTHPIGGFYSAEDADSEPPSSEDKQQRSGDSHSHEKKEGAFYVWKASELQAIFKKSGKFSDGDVKLFFLRYGIKENGNIRPESDPHRELKGLNHLYVARSIETLATDISAAELTSKLEDMRQYLFEIRTHRPRPHLDDKVLTSWNSLVISGLVKAAAAFDKAEYYRIAERAVRFIQQHLSKESNGVRIPLHSFRGNSVADIEAFLDDYAFLIQALLDLHEYDGRTEWIKWAKQLQDAQNVLFLDKEDGGYFSVSGNDPSILLRLKSDEDSAEPAGNSISCMNLSRLYSLTHDEGYLKLATGSAKSHALYLRRIPQAIPEMIRAMHSIKATIPQIIVVSKHPEDNLEMLKAIQRVYLPFKTLIRLATSEEQTEHSDTHYWLTSNPQIREYFQTVDDKPTLYVCKNFSCQLPITNTSQVEEVLLRL